MALLQDYNKLFEYTDNIKKVILNGNIVWPTGISSTPPGPDYTEPFYVENISDIEEELSIKKSSTGAPTLTIEYSTDKVTWDTFGTTSTSALTRTLAPGEKVYLRCNTNSWYENYSYNRLTGVSKVGGNIMSLLYGSSFTGQETSFPDATLGYILCRLFTSNINLVDASKLLLSATTLTNYCYAYMFQGCTSLTQAPALPATTLAIYCYGYMFSGCTSLTQAPALPATALTDSCYYYMFSRCTSLTQAPALPATTVHRSCYTYMFSDCTSLTQAPALPATTLASDCYYSMFSGCTSLTQAPALPATTLATYCYQYMFYGCTALTQAPALPATTLASECYSSMFSRCTSLTQAPALPATTLAGNCYYNMFQGCTSLTQAPALPATALTDGCYYYMFSRCTSLTQAPSLPATALVNYCYNSMFDGCTSLNNVTCLATSGIDISRSTYYWLSKVSSTGTFTKAAGVSWPTGNNGIPSGWTVVEV